MFTEEKFQVLVLMNTISITEKEHLFFERASTEKPSLILISDSN